MHPRLTKSPAVILTSLLFLCSLIIIPACQPPDPWKAEGDTLLNRAVALDHQLTALNTRIDSLWDTTTIRLAKALPTNFPPTDRDIFLKARNADHIKMFMSFKLLDSTTQALVNSAGEYDAVLAGEVHTLYAEQQDFEKQKIQFLQQVEEKDKAMGKAYAEKFRTATITANQ